MPGLEQNAIKTAGRHRASGQVVAGGKQQARLLVSRDAGPGTPEILAAACPDFDKDERAAITADQVDLPAAYPVIAFKDVQALFFQETCSGCFGFAPAGRSGIVAHCSHFEIMTMEYTALYVVPTPLGNLADLTRRAEEVLRSVPWIAAEDTRHSQPLLKHLGARARLLPAHQHNEHEAAERILEKLRAGESVALVSDAGTPGISDPGARIVAAVRAAGERVVPLPGACAATTAMSGAGLLDEHFLFYGFLPSKAGQRRQALEALSSQAAALVFYEAPHRVLETVEDMATILGERTLVIARELTKLFETLHSLPLADASAWLQADSNRQRGEFVLIVSGAVANGDDGEGERVLKLLLDEGLPTKQAAKLAAQITGAAKNALYERALALKNGA